MSDERSRPTLLVSGLAWVLRSGTLLAIGAVAIGYVLGLAGGLPRGERPIVDLIGAGGPGAIVGVGLLALTMIPLAVLAVAALGFARVGERSRLLTALGVLGLLIASLATAVLLAASG